MEMDENRMEEISASLKTNVWTFTFKRNGKPTARETQQRDISVFASWSELILRYRMNLNDVNPSNFPSSVFSSAEIPHIDIG